MIASGTSLRGAVGDEATRRLTDRREVIHTYGDSCPLSDMWIAASLRYAPFLAMTRPTTVITNNQTNQHKMKRIALTLAIVLGIAIGASAQNGGLFGKGPNRGFDDEYYDDYGTRGGGVFSLPSQHGTTNDESAPLGSGALLLIGFGAAYALKKQGKTRRS